MKKTFLLLITLSLFFFSCSDENSGVEPILDPYAKIEGLTEVRGYGISLLQHFSCIEERDYITYYKPVEITSSKNYLPENITEKYHYLSHNIFPFEVDKAEVIITTSRNKKNGERRHQLQFHYIPKLNNTNVSPDLQAYSIFITEIDKMPYYDRDDKEYTYNSHIVSKKCFGESSVLVHTIKTDEVKYHSTYHFMMYDAEDDKIYGNTRFYVNTIKIYHNGIFYFMVYEADDKLTREEAENIALKFCGIQ